VFVSETGQRGYRPGTRQLCSFWCLMFRGNSEYTYEVMGNTSNCLHVFNVAQFQQLSEIKPPRASTRIRMAYNDNIVFPDCFHARNGKGENVGNFTGRCGKIWDIDHVADACIGFWMDNPVRVCNGEGYNIYTHKCCGSRPRPTSKVVLHRFVTGEGIYKNIEITSSTNYAHMACHENIMSVPGVYWACGGKFLLNTLGEGWNGLCTRVMIAQPFSIIPIPVKEMGEEIVSGT